MLHDTAQYDSARKEVNDLRQSVAQIRSGAWVDSDQMYRDWNHSLVSFIQQVDRFSADPLLNSTAAYESLAGMAREAAITVKDIRQDPRKYLRLKMF
jgi:hypothetical protein